MHNEYIPVPPRDDDYVFGYDGRNVLMKSDTAFYQVKDVPGKRLYYLFRIDDTSFYMADLKDVAVNSINSYSLRFFDDQVMAYAAITGWQIYAWMDINRYCGRCGTLMNQDTKERAMRCPKCGNIVYPRIMPAVIVAVINEHDQLLVTKYAHGRYQKYALVAGFNEIGETIEQTCRREVREETGLEIEDLIYYKSQPWGFTSTLLFGFVTHVKGTDAITMDANELRVARWADRSEVLDTGGHASLTSEMIHMFQTGRI
jgi:NAD+ diphosphatase